MIREPAAVLRVVLSAAAVTGAVLHMLFPRFIPDLVTSGLIILAIVPWLSPIVKSIEIAGLGKLELNVEEVKEKQAILREDVDGLRFLVSGFVTNWELAHLKKLASSGPFDYVRGSGKDDRFTNELIRLWDFGLIAKLGDYSLHDMPLSGDLKKYVELTERGKTYLKLREQLQT